jgi:hypothetical protein
MCWLHISMSLSTYIVCYRHALWHLTGIIISNSNNIRSSVESLSRRRESGSSSHHEHENESMSPPQSLICLRALPADASEFAVGRIPSRVCLVRVPSECVRSKVVVRSLARSSARLRLSLSEECAGKRKTLHSPAVYLLTTYLPTSPHSDLLCIVQ